MAEILDSMALLAADDERAAFATWCDDVRKTVRETRLEFRPLASVAASTTRLQCALRDTSEFAGPQVIAFMRGRIDNWAPVVLRWFDDPDQPQVAFASDAYYFSRLCLVAITRDCEEMLKEDLRDIYDVTTDTVNRNVIDFIGRKADAYGDDAGLVFNLFMHVYYGFISEEHYQCVWPDRPTSPQKTSLGKMLKMHALHRLLWEHAPVREVASECVGVPPQRILRAAESMGITRDVAWVPYSDEWDALERQAVREDV